MLGFKDWEQGASGRFMMPASMPDKPILCLDFDGVIHSYERGWQGGEIYGSVTPGFFDWLNQAHRFFKIIIYSSRSKTEEGRAAMREWFSSQEYLWLKDKNPSTGVYPEGTISFAHEKPLAFLTIGNRALTFDGDWRKFDPSRLIQFKPWNHPR